MTSALDLLMDSDSAAETTTLLESNGICTIDSRTRTIFVPPEIIVGAVQSDKNAERIKFSCPKIVGDNLDLSKFSIRINCENVSIVDPDISIKDQYICEDASINGDNITFSWVIGKNAARYMGTTRFIVCAVKTDSDSNISIEWNTTVAQIPVLEGIEIDQPSLDENNKDVINQLLAITKTASDEAVKNVNSAKEQAITDIQNVSQPDKTLTVEGGIADAKATGNAISSLREDLLYQHGINTHLVVNAESKNQIISNHIEFLPGSYKITFNFNNTNKRVVALKKRNNEWVNQTETFEQKLYSYEFTVTNAFEAVILAQGIGYNIELADINEIKLYIKDTTNKLINYFSYLDNQLKNPLMENYKIENKENGYYNKDNTFISDEQYNCKRTELIKIEDGDKYLYKGVGKYKAISIIWYSDINEDIISSETYASGSSYKIVTPPTNAKYVRFFSFANIKYETILSVMKYLDKDTTTGDIDRIRMINNSNVLLNKTWVACGDSWTAGDFHGLSEEQYYDENCNMNKTYQYFIGKRNNMNIINNAVSGSTMAITKDYLDGTVQDKNFREPFSNIRYKNIEGIENADYITLMFGINDKYHSNIGSINDDTNETFYGAWNVVLKYYITNYPNAKIGVIIYSGDISADIHQALIAVSKNNGIPYLDLNSTDYPLIVNQCEDYVGAKQSIVNIRNSQNFVSGSNNHPNVRAQEKFSYIIEEWLRSI